MLAVTPLLIACGFAYINNSDEYLILGLLFGMFVDLLLLVFLFEPLFKNTIKYVNKKEKEKELLKQ